MHCIRQRWALVTLLLISANAGADEQLPAYVLELPASVGDVFIADTGDATLYRYQRDTDGVMLAETSYMSIGQNGIGKQKARDRKTPLGIYFVVDQIETRRLHQKYGIIAFPLDFPNVWDRRLERTGGGIWIHGVLAGGGQRPPLDTDGCLALPNENLRVLEKRFTPLITPVIVTREMHWQRSADRDALRDELKKSVTVWADALASSDAYAYLSMYARDFRYRGLSLDEWASLRVQSLQQRGTAEVAIDDLLLLADPEEEGLYLARFRQSISSKRRDMTTTKRLYWRRDQNGELKIVAEDNG